MDKIFQVRWNHGAVRPRTRWAACALIVVLGGWVHGARAGILTIDDFTEPGPATFFHLGTGSNPTTTLSQVVSGAFEGTRDATISVVGPGKPNSATGLIGHDPDYHVNAMQVQTNGLSPTIATVHYGLPSGGTTGSSLPNPHPLTAVAGVDLTNGGQNDLFLLEFLYVDASPASGLDFTITITSPGGKSSTTKTEMALNMPSAINFYVPFTDLSGNASPNDVDSIQYVFNGVNKTANADYVVQLLGTTSLVVPEPAGGTLMAIALGVLSLAAHCARRRQSRRSRAET